MRWRTLIAILGCLLLSAVAQAELEIFACEPEWGALAKELGGERVDVYDAITGLQDVHFIQARPSLIAKLRRADLLICTGADLEIGWLPLLLRQANNPRVQKGQPGYFEASQFVELLEVPVQVDRAEGDIHPYGNPHIQLDPRNIAVVATALAERLEALDPSGASFYRQRQADFASRWQEAVQGWTELASCLNGMQIVTHHRSWVYMDAWLGLDDVATLEPKPGVPPTTRHLGKLLNSLELEDAKLIVRSAYQPARASDWLSGRTGIPADIIPHTVGSVTGADDLFGLFNVMIQRLREAADEC